jgi:hypothetical protein
VYRTVQKSKAKILCLDVSVIKQSEIKGPRLLSQYTFGNLLFFETGYLIVQRIVCLCARLSFYSGHGLEFSLLFFSSGSLVVIYQRKT